MTQLSSPLSSVLKTTSQKLNLLKTLGIHTIQDLLFYFPFRYVDQSEIRTVNLFNLQELNTSCGRLSRITNEKTKYGKVIQKAIFTDEQGAKIECIWFQQPYLSREWNKETKVRISGKVRLKVGKLSFVSPIIESWNDEQIHTAEIIPIYHETEGISSKWLREKIFSILPFTHSCQDILPKIIQKEFGFPKKSEAVKSAHFPKDPIELEKSKQMLAFEELFLLQLQVLEQKRVWSLQEDAVALPINPDLMKQVQKELPFTLTNSQKICLYQILKDCEKPYPMLRLLQGDVGSGKTVVAALAMIPFLEKGYQCVVMSPTEILAKQHFTTLQKFLNKYSSALLIGSLSEKEKKNLHDKISRGEIQLIIGTHALIQDSVSFLRLAFAVIDEQHRFGVAQRAELIKKSINHVPHLLMMSATPIPRTLALTLYGDQELSIIDEMPPGRKKIITKIIHPEKRKQANYFIEDQIKKGRQIFVICPLIEDSELLETKSVLTEFERLKKEDFPHRNIVYLHGKMSTEEKDMVMKKFKNKEFDILVSTSVIEVGIDISNATIIVIEGAERFGLSQLHQFRGRVGRNDMQSYCFLYTSKREQQSLRRLKALSEFQNGFQLAEVDLHLRGPGEIYGFKQSGLADLKMASLMDIKTIALAREKAKEYIEQDPTLSSYPLLQSKINKDLIFLKA